jgi:PAS domain S-box-containing protein
VGDPQEAKSGSSARQDLLDDSQKCRHLFEHLNDAAFLVDAETGRILEANQQAGLLLAMPPSEIVGMQQADLHPPERAGVYQQRLAAHVAEGRATDLDCEVVRKDGAVIPVAVRASILTIRDERLVLTLFRDVTEHKRVEEELRAAKERAEQTQHELELAKSGVDRNAAQLAEALFEAASQKAQAEKARQATEEANRLMNNILSSVSSIVIAVDENNRVTQWNPAAERTFGVPAAKATGTPFSKCPIGWDSTETIETIAACCEAHEPVQLDEIRFTRPGGTTGLLSVSINPMRDEHGGYLGFVLLGSDVTEQKVLEEDLSRAQKLESVGALAAGIAHEINTPIQFVGDNTRFLSDSFEELGRVLEAYRQLKETAEAQGTAPELLSRLNAVEQEADVEYLNGEIPKAIDQTLEGVARVAKIVRAMKDFSHPDQGEKSLADLNQALESTLTVARNELKYVADVVTDFDPALPPVPCYLSDMNQVFLNLLVNAAHAITDVVGNGKSGKATGKGTITVTTRDEGKWAVIRIADTGTGIPKHVRDRIFDPFFTTKTVGRGTGQGLSIARKVVVDAHGGSLTFETEVGKGTTFIIRLPIESGPASTGESDEKADPLR